MRVLNGETRPGPPLATVLRELADKLNADDWMRCSTSDDSSFYYIVGMQAHIADQEGRADHMSLSIPRRAPVAALSELRVHAQVASPKSSAYYVRQAMSRLVRCGVDPIPMAKFVEGESPDLSFLQGHIGGTGSEGFLAFADLLQTMVMAKGMDPYESSTEAERRSELDVAVQKVYLTELSRVYEGVVERAVLLESLAFEDPQLNEASRCYLYGFNRAAIVLAAAAVETHLKRRTGKDWFDRYADLVDTAFWAGLLDDSLREAATKVFRTRRGVVHSSAAPSDDETSDTLALARTVVKRLHP